MSERDRLLQSIATITADYQAGVLPTPTAAHVDRWIGQFPADVQLPVLAEMDHVLARTYFSKARVERFLANVVGFDAWTKGDPASFWRGMHFLDLQPKGNSQREFLRLFDAQLIRTTGLSIADCGKGDRFLYLDDGLFSGGRLGSDLVAWIEGPAPQHAELFVAVIALHAQGKYFTTSALDRAIATSGKTIAITWGKAIPIEDGIFQDKVDHADVLRPTGPGDDPAVAAYVAALGKGQTWRRGTSVGPQKFFSSNAGRHLLEQNFLATGVAVRAMCPNFNEHQRPLGNTTMRTTGFGTLFATYRNCPNNAPLVLWAGDPWYPLLRRATN